MNRILIIAPSWIGDLVMTQSLFNLLKSQDPYCIIDVVASKNLHQLLQHMPEVDNYIISPLEHGKINIIKTLLLIKQLRKTPYTHAYVIPNSFKSALIPFLAGIPVRTGWLGESRHFLLNNIKPAISKDKLFVERILDLGLKTNEQIITNNFLPRLLAPIEKTYKKILALCPGAEYGPAKRWPTKYFAQIAKDKRQQGWEIWIIGGPNDQLLAQEIQEHSENSCIDFTGRTNLSQAIELLAQTSLVISNDSGLMHIAAALNRPLIAIFGSTSPKFTPPLALNNQTKIVSLNLSCSPCFKKICPLKHTDCLNKLYPESLEDFL